ncbi:MAG: CPBP family intramembrane metalloprotease [Oscillospiraceae bacterium]|nr:CPBP family intramembrane metalloprotease [Oscillospiraceae bacterium]
MKTEAFTCTMKRGERILGLLYIFVHAVGIPRLMGLLVAKGILNVDMVWLEFIQYAFGLTIALVFMHRFLRQSFHAALDNIPGFILTLLLGFGLYWILSLLVNGGLLLILGEDNMLNPNNEAVQVIAKQNFGVTKATAVLLAPILEETLFRGALFGGLREKNRLLAYLVTIAIFAFYHLWSWFVADYSPLLWAYLLQYVPATLVLCWMYEKSRSIWCPILLHMAINLIAVQAQKLL